MTPPGILCSGSIVYDTIVRPFDEPAWGTTRWVQSIEYHVGGNGANTARALAILGNRVRLFGALGTDPAGDFISEHLRASGVELDHVMRVSKPTATSIVLVNSRGDRQFLHRLGASEEAFRDPLAFTPELCEGSSHYHFASLFVLPHLRRHGPEMLRRAKHVGLSTSLDTNWDAEGHWMNTLAPCLPHVDVLFMNEDEAYMLTGTRDPAQCARVAQSAGASAVVIKLGCRGCAIYTEGREIVCPPFAVKAKDTTGAGDCFVGGFLSAKQRGWPWDEAGTFANAVAALSVQNIGAVTGLLSFSETEAWMRAQCSTLPIAE